MYACMYVLNRFNRMQKTTFIHPCPYCMFVIFVRRLKFLPYDWDLNNKS